MRDVISGVFLIGVSLIAIWGAWLVPPASPGDTWAGTVPFAAAIALLALSVLLTVSGFSTHATEAGSARFIDAGTIDILVLVVIAILYQQSFRWFGYVLPTALVAPLILYLFGVRHKIGLAASVVVCPLVYYIVFFQLLGVFPPYGEVFDLMSWIQG